MLLGVVWYVWIVYVDLYVNFGNICVFSQFFSVVLLQERYLEGSIFRSLFWRQKLGSWHDNEPISIE